MITPQDFIMSKEGIDFRETTLSEGCFFERRGGVSEIVIGADYEKDDRLIRFKSIRWGKKNSDGTKCIMESGYYIDKNSGEAIQSFSGVYYQKDTLVDAPRDHFSNGRATLFHASKRFSELDKMLEMGMSGSAV